MAEAFLSGLPDSARREWHRYVHVFRVVAEENGRRRRHSLAVFLTESDAEVAKRLVEPHVASDRPN
ncbi:hypothetical protein GA0070624_1377 [Micromonospora rhizosphaerae]|uniref:Uncharacterized protein n=1 Tax=Micromonospora rhizosphaerae TaxID=568872 RepID=A0A1C6RL41_9ACTN|nr:hypothetical protein [Micromonospora rhizosphaerae]SCL17783.1 hypothetical protein GA0070624_1377 [Micromonospora rhizosphaerae]